MEPRTPHRSEAIVGNAVCDNNRRVAGDRPLKIRAICCNVFRREFYAAAAQSRNTVDLEFLPQGLHDLGAAPMRTHVQAAIDAVDPEYDAIVLGYGLCNNGCAGLVARNIPLIIPRAHDCITLFLGNHTRYMKYFEDNPGVYFKTTGWMERDTNPEGLLQQSIQRRAGMDMEYEALVSRYGPENAAYLFETLCCHTQHYRMMTYIELAVVQEQPWIETAKADAADRGWEFEHVTGDLRLIRGLLDGPWGAEYLQVMPGESIKARYDDQIFEAVATKPASQAGAPSHPGDAAV